MVEAKKTMSVDKKTTSVAKKTTSTAKASATTKTATKTATAATPADKPAAKTPATAKKATPATKSGLLKLHHLKPAPGAHPAKTRVGRGEASKGKTAGRGTKGTAARYQVKVGFEGGQMPLHMRLPKLRGFKNPFRLEFQVVNLERLEKHFPNGGKVTIEDLVNKGLVRNDNAVKLLGEGTVTQSFEITVDAASKSAIAAIEKAGGKVNIKTPEELKALKPEAHKSKTIKEDK